jgi:hypothetical protein
VQTPPPPIRIEISEKPLREFLETYPLYRKFPMVLPERLNELPRPPINMSCEVCSLNQTFIMKSNFAYDTYVENQGVNVNTHLAVTAIRYVCTSCDKFLRTFLIKFNVEEGYIMKVGQEPGWEISADHNIEKILGSHTSFYRKGLICESQSYGIGAFAYYRRIIEGIIDHLLTEITYLINIAGQERYLEALNQVKQTHNTEEKIRLVKDLLPSILKPDGINPLDILHSALSKGLHSKSDEECAELSANIREALIFLVKEVLERKSAAQTFTENMRKLLNRKGK